MSQNTMSTDIAEQIAQRTLARRGAGYVEEVRRLLDAALAVMRAGGPDARARVADIVAAAGLSNDAFYRHFPSKDALVTALIDDGSARLRGYLAHQMAKESTPDGRIRRWVEGVLSQARGDVAEATLAVMVNAGARPRPDCVSTRPATCCRRCWWNRSRSSAAPRPSSTPPSSPTA